ncbi:MAG: phage baseplate protein [Bacteroidales bacterium]
MTVETNANFISELNRTFPRNRDLIKEGDDHIRLIKSTLQNTFPGITSAVTATSDKLNKLDRTFVYEEDTLNINSSLMMGEGLKCDVGGSVIENVGDPKEETDAVNLRSLQGSLVWPVGSIFMTVDARNPNIILGFGSWSKFAAGRVIVGTGSTTDSLGNAKSFVNEQRGGDFSVKITEDQLPAHKHSLEGGSTKSDGAHKHAFKQLQIASPSPDTKHDSKMAQYNEVTYYTEVDGAHKHALEGSTAATGKAASVNNMQPYIACNIWVRNPDE